MNKYRVLPGNNDQNLLAAGKSFGTTLSEDEQLFTDHGMPTDFIAKVKSKTEAFEQAVTKAEAAYGERVGTNAAFAEPARAAKKLVDKLTPTIKRTYRNNPRKLAEWLIASHVEKPPKPAQTDEDKENK